MKQKSILPFFLVFILSLFLSGSFVCAQTGTLLDSEDLSAAPGSQTDASDADSEKTTSDEKESEFFLLLDASGSMDDSFDSGTKMSVAQDVIAQTMENFSDNVSFSFFAYGSSVSSSNQSASCKDVTQITRSSSRAGAEAEKISPTGNAPLGHALEEMSEDFSKNAETVVFVVLDGSDNCDDQFVDTFKQIQKATPFRLYVAGIDLSSDDEDEIRQVVALSEGRYFEVSDQDDLSEALVNVTASVAGDSSNEIEKIVGGSDFENAKLFSDSFFGKRLSIQDHLQSNEYEYWRLVLEPGQGAQITVRTGNKDIQFSDDGEVTETDDSPTGGLVVFNENETKVFDVTVQQEKNGTKTGNIYSTSSESDSHTFYLAVGSWLSVHEDMQFTVDLIEEYDEVAGQGDLANSFRDRLSSVVSGGYTGYLSQGDVADFYRLEAFAGQTVRATVVPSRKDGDFTLELYGSLNDVIYSERSEEPGESVTFSHAVTDDEVFAVGVRRGLGKYTLNLAIEGEREDEEVAPVISSDSNDLINVDGVQQESFFSGWRLVLFVAIIILVLLAGGGVALYFYVFKNNKKESAKQVPHV